MRILFAVCAAGLLAVPATAQPPVFVRADTPPQFVAGCLNCETRSPSSFGSAYGPRVGPLGALTYPWTIGEGCRMPVGCSSLLAERTFFFGSCRQFYTPGNKCSLFPKGACGVGGAFGGEGNCVYGSFHNK